MAIIKGCPDKEGTIQLNRKRQRREAKLDPRLKPQGNQPRWNDLKREEGNAGAEWHVPFLAVLSHTHPASVPRRGVAARSLPHLEADPTGGAAGRPGGPGGPAAIPGETKQSGHRGRVAHRKKAPGPLDQSTVSWDSQLLWDFSPRCLILESR